MLLQPRKSSKRTSFAALAGHALALLALVGQIGLPWLKGWHDARERSAVDAAVVTVRDSGLQLAQCPDSQPHHEHDGAACPVCRLIGHSPGALLLGGLGCAAAPRAEHTAHPHRGDTPQTPLLDNAAPRGPPIFLA